jgi:hypothetical protein
MSTQSTVRFVAFVILAVACNRSNPAQQGASPAEGSQLAQDMIGAWVHVGRPGNVHEIPAEGGRFKFRTGRHWTLVQADPTGLVIEQFGGTYTLNRNEYVETQQYADSHWIRDNGKSFKFTVKVEGDTMTQVGIDNPYTEVWKRAK